MDGITFSLPDDMLVQIKTAMTAAANDAFKQAATNQQLPEKWLDLGQACQYAGVARNTLNKFIDDGLKITIIGNVKRISKPDIDSYLEAHSI
ncbi:helix-turn-helix domain-containing protein [Loigolactobacillus bifermentans]|uniref:Helix-turn-helix domain-containing protein n=1 Tax=Loigolactobacillus bifermentans DSM 20003 TaxID=1423726 RepID=A0A0R1H7U9_9LACO|nr:helix-turn-helix domain-containing protein [Loigolactobacillus bifermentans]KRK39953.1 hypothetical protein FC07_GL001909 [Loigolactobacillus bifermentans DSM 20003]QGG59742.1 hypothetical protein LB003_04155 [Loigolactobacillus bifermentans]